MHWLAALTVVAATRVLPPPCGAPAFDQERRDVATILRLEKAWSVAFLQGDTAFERCLLAPTFAEILRTGEMTGLAGELSFATKNVAHPRRVPPLPRPTVVLLADGAVAYGIVKGKMRTTRYADFYVWTRSQWQVVFAQQTVVQTP